MVIIIVCSVNISRRRFIMWFYSVLEIACGNCYYYYFYEINIFCLRAKGKAVFSAAAFQSIGRTWRFKELGYLWTFYIKKESMTRISPKKKTQQNKVVLNSFFLLLTASKSEESLILSKKVSTLTWRSLLNEYNCANQVLDCSPSVKQHSSICW